MLRYAIIFLAIALVAAVLGFGIVSGVTLGIAEVLFYVFLVLLIIGVSSRLLRRRTS